MNDYEAKRVAALEAQRAYMAASMRWREVRSPASLHELAKATSRRNKARQALRDAVKELGV